MAGYRNFAPGEYLGEKIFLPDLKRKSERKGLIGKRIGYDVRGSCMLHFGWVTALSQCGKGLEIDGSDMELYRFEQIVVLFDQGEPA